MEDITDEEWEHSLDTVVFYCPKCKSMLIQTQACDYTCPCGLKWKTPNPICISDENIIPIREVNGERY